VGRLVKLTPEGPDGTDFGWGMPVGQYEVAEQGGKPVLFFSAETPGRVLFVLQAVAAPRAAEQRPEKTLVFFWLDVVGADGKPEPNPGPAPAVSLVERTRRAFASPDGTFTNQAKADAKALQIALTAVAEVLATPGKITTRSQLDSNIQVALAANNWTKGRYPAINAMVLELSGGELPDAPLDDAAKARALTYLRDGAVGAKLAAEWMPKGGK
jgi:hypothetical protein